MERNNSRLATYVKKSRNPIIFWLNKDKYTHVIQSTMLCNEAKYQKDKAFSFQANYHTRRSMDPLIFCLPKSMLVVNKMLKGSKLSAFIFLTKKNKYFRFIINS